MTGQPACSKEPRKRGRSHRSPGGRKELECPVFSYQTFPNLPASDLQPLHQEGP